MSREGIVSGWLYRPVITERAADRLRPDAGRRCPPDGDPAADRIGHDVALDVPHAHHPVHRLRGQIAANAVSLDIAGHRLERPLALRVFYHYRAAECLDVRLTADAAD